MKDLMAEDCDVNTPRPTASVARRVSNALKWGPIPLNMSGTGRPEITLFSSSLPQCRMSEVVQAITHRGATIIHPPREILIAFHFSTPP